ncbi:hypothetical protein ES705_06825 [subsurface metagenome]
MSILVVQVLYEGIIFGADRNVTRTSIHKTEDGKTVYIFKGQSQRPKVLRWPNNKALIGYVGAATIGGIPTDEWLYDFIGRNFGFQNFEALAYGLKDEVQAQRIIDEGHEEAELLIIHVAGFEEREEHQVPVIWYITNSHKLDPNIGYTEINKDFGASEEFWKKKYVGHHTPQDIRIYLREKAENYEPFWFHQGFDLAIFNTLDFVLRKSIFRLLIKNHPNHKFPSTLNEWSQYFKMSILTYQSYFQSFYGPSEQYVGGGVDIVSLPWPN